MLNLKIIIGGTRPTRAADKVIPWITSASRAHGGFEVDVLDLRDWELPLFGETFATVGDPANPVFSVPAVKRRNEKIAEGDAYLFITPEYNHCVPAVLKNDIDSALATFAFRTKPTACVAYSGGIAGGDDPAWWGTALRQARSRGMLPPAIMRLMAAQKGAAK
jgi:NAD(P)H-dependent FMN reductase